MTPKAVLNIQAVLVLFGTIAAWVFLPHQLLRPLALALLGGSVAGVFAVKAYLQRLHDVLTFVESNRDSQRPDVLRSILTSLERRVLCLGTPMDAGHAIEAIRQRQSLVTSAGMALGMLAIGAGMITIVAYSD